MFCPQCGTNNKPEAKFCVNCGWALPQSNSETNNNTDQGNPQQENSQQGNYQQDNYQQNNYQTGNGGYPNNVNYQNGNGGYQNNYQQSNYQTGNNGYQTGNNGYQTGNNGYQTGNGGNQNYGNYQDPYGSNNNGYQDPYSNNNGYQDPYGNNNYGNNNYGNNNYDNNNYDNNNYGNTSYDDYNFDDYGYTDDDYNTETTQKSNQKLLIAVIIGAACVAIAAILFIAVGLPMLRKDSSEEEVAEEESEIETETQNEEETDEIVKDANGQYLVTYLETYTGTTPTESFIYDYDGDGNLECYAYTTDEYGSATNYNVNIYFVDTDGNITEVENGISGEVGNDGQLLNVSGDNYFVWEAGLGGAQTQSYLYGVVNGQYSQPTFSGTDVPRGIGPCTDGSHSVIGYNPASTNADGSYADTYYDYDAASRTFTEAAVDTGSEGLIFPDIQTRILTDAEVSALSDEDLQWAINDLYALHGYAFTKDKTKSHYGALSWYQSKGLSQDQAKATFNSIELKNVGKLQTERERRGI